MNFAYAFTYLIDLPENSKPSNTRKIQASRMLRALGHRRTIEHKDNYLSNRYVVLFGKQLRHYILHKIFDQIYHFLPITHRVQGIYRALMKEIGIFN